MAYETTEVILETIGDAGIDADTLQAINNVLAGLSADNANGEVLLEEITGDDTASAADAEVIVVSNPGGTDIGDTDAELIVAGDGSGPLNVDIETSNAAGERFISGSEQGDSVSVGSSDDAVIDAGGGDDSVSSGGGGDSITGGEGDDTVDSGAGGDTVSTGQGNDSVNTGEGLDKVETADAREGSTISSTSGRGIDSTGQAVVITDASGERTVLENAEYVEFADGAVEIFAKDNVDATVARLYEAIFDRDTDFAGYNFYVDQATAGKDLAQIAREISASPEFQELTGGLTDAEFIDHIYNNLFERDADAAGKQFYLEQFASGENDRGKLVADLAFSEEAIEIVGNVTIIPGMFDIA